MINSSKNSINFLGLCLLNIIIISHNFLWFCLFSDIIIFLEVNPPHVSTCLSHKGSTWEKYRKVSTREDSCFLVELMKSFCHEGPIELLVSPTLETTPFEIIATLTGLSLVHYGWKLFFVWTCVLRWKLNSSKGKLSYNKTKLHWTSCGWMNFCVGFSHGSIPSCLT